MTDCIKYNLLDEVVRRTHDFIVNVPKNKRKIYGQFFTTASTARFMADLFKIDFSKSHLELLDAGAGTGILSVALLDHIFKNNFKGTIHLTCYETDDEVLPILQENLLLAKKVYSIDYTILKENYITAQYFAVNSLLKDDCEKYDYIIGNPPYLKISKDAPEAKAMPDVCHGAPNLYFLFWAMGIRNLKSGQELVYIIPRSWTSGAYFRKFRNYLFSQCVITDVHLFKSRNKVFDRESVLQETIIIKVKKTTEKPLNITITTSSTCDFNDIRQFQAPYDMVVSKNQYVYLVTDLNDACAMGRINRLTKTLPDIHLKMQTGIIVDFRTREVIRDEMEDGAFPLLCPGHIKDGKVIWPVGKAGEVIKTDRSSYLQENSDFLIIKRFTAKEEKRRLQCGIYLRQRYTQFAYISTQNKVNFVKCDSPCITYGLYALLNSTLYDTYYRIMNGSTQVNSTEINQMPIPERDVIEAMGRELMYQNLTEENCNKIVDRWIS